MNMLVPLCPGLGVIGYVPNFSKHPEASHQVLSIKYLFATLGLEFVSGLFLVYT